MTPQILLSVASVAQRLSRSDYTHKLGLAVLAQPEGPGWAFVVLAVETGEVLAFDGWYYEEQPFPAEFMKSVVDGYDWDDWDDMPSKLLLGANGYWLGVMIDLLQPEYSLDDCAATALELHFDGTERLRDFTTVAYYPLRIEAVIAHVEAQKAAGSKLPSFHEGPDPLDAVLEKLRSL